MPPVGRVKDPTNFPALVRVTSSNHQMLSIGKPGLFGLVAVFPFGIFSWRYDEYEYIRFLVE
jgi:hypothetical protein